MLQKHNLKIVYSMCKSHYISFIICLFLTLQSHAEIVLPHIFTDHMVLQRNISNTIWGWANPGERIKVDFKNQSVNTIASQDGTWKVKLKPESAGGSFTLAVKGDNEIVLKDILVGEVWICSGQSNMDFTLLDIGNKEAVKTANHTNIRQVIIPKEISFSTMDNTKNNAWTVCSPETAGQYSAVGYFFALNLYRELNIPIGLIKSAWGGTNIEPWISTSAIQTHPDFKNNFEKCPNEVIRKFGENLPGTNELLRYNIKLVTYPSVIYNAMIHPITNYAIKGIIWYQGESNASEAKQYTSLFPLLINDWRTKYKNKKLPFYFVQLASYNANNANGVNGSEWAELRDAQRKALTLPHTGMAVIVDVGDANDIHPFDKKTVGDRLALHALKNDYGKKVVCSGPLYKSVKFKKNKAYLSFNSVGSGLTIRKGDDKLKGFLIAGSDGKFLNANAVIEGKKVVVYNNEIPNPIAVRYAWTDVTDYANLYNLEGLPASPFRTDEFIGLTDGNKYKYIKKEMIENK